MSGTSLDGVDGLLINLPPGQPFEVLAHASTPFDAKLRAELLALNQRSGEDELHRAQLAANGLARHYAQVVQQLLSQTNTRATQVRAIGAHGQTLRHQPQMHDGVGYTVQLNQAALLAELSGIAVVADFRSRDVAAGGQGAPLAPFFHRAWLGQPLGQTLEQPLGKHPGQPTSIVVLNLGGIANLTVLGAGGAITAFDCGPGNMLLDAWCEQQLGQPFDADGAWAASASPDPALLARMLDEPFFALPPPKSTGRDLFNLDWLQRHLNAHAASTTAPPLTAAQVQATLAELSASACAQALARISPNSNNTAVTAATDTAAATNKVPEGNPSPVQQLVVCGGGAYNGHLLRRLQALCPLVRVCRSDSLGLAPLHVEAAAFAWLAQRCLDHAPLALTPTTGAAGARVLGAIYPA